MLTVSTPNKLETGQGYQFSKAITGNDVLLLAILDLLPKQHHLLEKKCSNT